MSPRPALLALTLATSVAGATPSILDSLPPDVAEAANWLANGTFEEGENACPCDWVFLNQHQKVTGTWETTGAHSGKQCVSIKGDDGLSYARWVTAYRFPVEAGARLRVGFWYRGRGGSARILGSECRFDPATGTLTENLVRHYDTVLSKPEPTTEWRWVEAEFAQPDYPGWARLCLSGGGRDTCSFDDAIVLKPGLSLVKPRSPALVNVGAPLQVEVFPGALADTDPSTIRWESLAPGLKLLGATPDAARHTWRLNLEATSVGVHDLALRAQAGKAPAQELRRPRFVRVHPPLGGTFAFAVLTDAHFYRPGQNERNEKFGRVAALLNGLDPLFTLDLGDHLEISSGATDAEKKLLCEAAKEQLGRLAMPVFSVAGNHDVDKTFEGAGSRWYEEKYLGHAPWHTFSVEGVFFAGINTMVPGIYGRDHGGGFVRPGQAEALTGAFQGTRAGFPIFWGHVSPYGEFPEGADRNRLLELLYGNHARLVLTGHVHNNGASATRQPATPSGPWPKPEALPDAGALAERLADPQSTVFLETTTSSAFLLGGCPFNAVRYFWMRDGAVAWQDLLPLGLSVSTEPDGPRVRRVRVKNGADKPLVGLPLSVSLPPGRVAAKLGDRSLAVRTTPGPSGQTAWVQVDVPLNADLSVELRSSE